MADDATGGATLSGRGHRRGGVERSGRHKPVGTRLSGLNALRTGEAAHGACMVAGAAGLSGERSVWPPKECAGTDLARQSWRDSRDGAEGAAATIGEEATDMWAPAGDERERGGDGPLTSGPQRRTSLVG
jgi:hypothetical protein